MKKFLVLMLVLLLVVAAPGCGIIKNVIGDLEQIGDQIDDMIGDTDDNDDDDNNDDYNDDDESQPIIEGNVFYPQDFKEVLAKFKEFGYVWTSVKSDGETNDWSFYYKAESDGAGSEVFNVVKVEEGKTSQFKFWFDEEWSCIKAMEGEEEKEIYEGALLTMMVQLYVNQTLLTTTVIKDDGTIDTFSHSFVSKYTEGANLGQGSATLFVYEILGKFGNITYTYGLAEVDGELVYALIKHEGSSSEEMRFTHLVPR